MRKLSKSKVVLKRLRRFTPTARETSSAVIADLIGAVDGLPAEEALSAHDRLWLRPSPLDSIKPYQRSRFAAPHAQRSERKASVNNAVLDCTWLPTRF